MPSANDSLYVYRPTVQPAIDAVARALLDRPAPQYDSRASPRDEKACIDELLRRINSVGATVMENKSITSAFSRQHSEHKPPTTLLILFEIISLAVLARFSWQRRGNKLLFWGLIAVIAII